MDTPENEVSAIAEEQPAAPEETIVDQEQPAEGQASEEEEQPKPEKKDRLQLRFSDLTRQRDEKAAEAEYWRQEALRQQQAQPQPASETPDPSQYDQGEYDPRYLQDMIDHRVEMTLRARSEQEAQVAAQREQAQKVTSLRDKLFESGLEGAIAIASGANIPVSPAMVEALAESENAALVADHLGRNTAEAARIASLPTSVQGYELAKLEARLAGQPKPTTAAKPPPPVLSGSRGAPVGGLRDDMPIDQWMALHNEGRR